MLGTLVAGALVLAAVAIAQLPTTARQDKPLRLYWLIPDGFRTDPDVFTLFTWAEEGKLPNIKRLMERGSYGFSIPDFPSHTPANYATLMTGSHPETHGVFDGPIRSEGYPLHLVPVGGFQSTAKKVPPLWYTLEKRGMKGFLLSVPGSTPPELSKGVTIRGRWGAWGVDFNPVTFQDPLLPVPDGVLPRASNLFFYGADLQRKTSLEGAEGWSNPPSSFSPPKETAFQAWGTDVYGYIADRTDDGHENYDTLVLSKNKSTHLAELREGEWSDWIPIQLFWQTGGYDKYAPKRLGAEESFRTVPVDTSFRAKVIRLDDNGSFRVRFLYDNLNQYLARPAEASERLTDALGPMVDFADSYPPQLISYPEDKQTFLEEAAMSFEWHRKAISFLLDAFRPEAVIHAIYTPNQMLTSRWWLGYTDPASARYGNVSEGEREQIWSEVMWMYQEVDAMVGEILNKADENAVIVLSSDHGAAPYDTRVAINSAFAKEGLLFTKRNPQTDALEVDWENTKAVFLRMYHVYVNPNGFGGAWHRPSGEEYERLRLRVKHILENLEDEQGIRPIQNVVMREDASEVLHLPEDGGIGDLLIVNRPGHFSDEELPEDGKVFSEPLESGYKQGINPRENPAVWTPFIIAGPGVRENYRIQEPFSHIRQYPTVMRLLGEKVPEFVEGVALDEIIN